MNYRHIIQQLETRRENIDRALIALEALATGHKRRGRPPAWMKQGKRRGRPPGSKNRVKEGVTA